MAENKEPTGPHKNDDHIVQDGECIESIAHRHGFFWQTVWDDKHNAELKRLRDDPFVLMAGDRVFVPELRRREEECATDSRHTFRRNGIPSQFRIQILAGGEPRADEPFVALIDDMRHQGRTDENGWVELSIAPDARGGELIVGEEGEDQDRIELDLGGLDPVTEITGVQKRLENLGFDCGEPGELDDETKEAIAEFQESEEMEPTGELNDETRTGLVKVHGS